MDECALCGVTRAEHDSPDIHHVFTLEGDLTPRAKSPKPIVAGPGRPATSNADRILLNLLTVLTAKSILSPDELTAIIGGELISDPSKRPTHRSARSGDRGKAS